MRNPFRIQFAALIFGQEFIAFHPVTDRQSHQPAFPRHQLLVDIVKLLNQALDPVIVQRQ